MIFMMWPTEYVELKRIDELLICGICYEYINTSVMTLCSHNYCSLCIRKYLHYKTQCPTCFEETFEKDLRKNKVLDEIIDQYLDIKKKFEKTLHNEEMTPVRSEYLEVECSSNDSGYEKKVDVPDTSEILQKDSNSPVLAVNISTPHARKDHQQNLSSPSTSTSPRIPLIFTPKSRKGFRNDGNCKMVTCPVCKVDIPQDNINIHLDNCLKRESTKHQSERNESKRKPLPKLVLSLMKDNIIRKKLKELGLSCQGDRKVLENRLQKYIILYNAECDKTNPRPVSELIKQCEEEESLEKKAKKPSNRLNINRNTEHNIIEKQRKKYLTANKDSFKQLIAAIKNVDRSPKLPVRRNILKKEDVEIPCENRAIENDSTVKHSETGDFLPMNTCIDDSDSNASCPLQMYSSENPMNFLTIELPPSSDDDTDQHPLRSNHDTTSLHCKTNSIPFNPIVNMENIKTELLSFESTSMHEEAAPTNLSSHTTNTFQTREYDVSETRMDTDTKESLSKLIVNKTKNEEAKLPTKRRYGIRSQKHVVHSRDRNIELSNKAMESIVEDKRDVADGTDKQLDYEGSKHGLHNVEEYASDCTKFEKENMESLDENINLCVFQKRDRDMVFTLSDDDKIDEDRSTNGRKSTRLGLSEAKRFNNENFNEITLQNEEKSKSEKEQQRAIYAKGISSSAKRSLRLKSKIRNSMRSNNVN